MHAQDAADLIALAIDAMRFGQLDAVRDEIVTKYGLIHTQVDHLTAWMTAGDGGRAGENDIVRGSSALAEGGAPGVAPVPDVLSTSVARLSFNSMAMSPLTADQSITTASLMAAAGSKEIMAVLKALRLMQQREEPAGQILSYISVKRDLITVFGGAVFDHAKPHVQAWNNGSRDAVSSVLRSFGTVGLGNRTHTTQKYNILPQSTTSDFARRA